MDMDQMKTVGEWRRRVSPVLQSKVEELHLLGYEQATKEEIWNCLIKKVWNGEPEKRLHEIVQDIFRLSSHTYTGYLTAEAYESDDLLASIEALEGS
ncbi:post-transcriptional regulator [Halobacillus sp. BAB-2008]|uniref:post-transcriptional regulator n=1 Tax=Halobacillus sp. BAB-2008 TaxID=1246484 RepID=UPI0002A51F63|nr:hypothetical protein D479_17554 [Halobacillus sp. BAB-2008]